MKGAIMKLSLVVNVLVVAAAVMVGGGCAKKTESGLVWANFQKEIGGKQADLFVMKNSRGMEICVTSYGARVVSWLVPDRNGKMADVVLGYEKVQEYVDSKEPYFGAAIGRYGNRLAKGKFSVDGVEYSVPVNNGPNALHGGPVGFQALVWDVKQVDGRTLECGLVSEDGDQGFPGALRVKMVYELTEENELKITYAAETDKATVVNLTHHSFFNLHGAGMGTINDHLMMIDADRYTPVDVTLIPTGEIAAVEGTPMDFRKMMAIGTRVGADFEQLNNGAGYDHNWALNRKGAGLELAARVVEPKSGRVLEVFTTEPGLQFYGGNFLDDSFVGKGGKVYGHRTAFCLETQHFPDSPNHPNFPSTVLRPGEKYSQVCVYRFSTEK